MPSAEHGGQFFPQVCVFDAWGHCFPPPSDCLETTFSPPAGVNALPHPHLNGLVTFPKHSLCRWLYAVLQAICNARGQFFPRLFRCIVLMLPPCHLHCFGKTISTFFTRLVVDAVPQSAYPGASSPDCGVDISVNSPQRDSKFIFIFCI